ncbi:hypothetical protein GKZ68_08110 [Hymenobacter sp. BRD128]|uniref:hypothetical protein n=1 Tax=Hymenobacter sp. BRD128 TaxID=2675878 RepID=UPI0015636F73|nr:hypothetical protein [Hymenobacter sp. BRD128]QKG56595.1 hypothetical protein GKZ68_08110 [Hymenobacter sp. BRD128]
MRKLSRAGWIISGLALIAGCQPDTKSTEKAQLAALPVRATSAASSSPAALAAPYTGYHRYQGTVGGQLVTVELTFKPAHDHEPAACQGSYYYGYGKGGTLALESNAAYQPGRPLALTEPSDTEKRTITGQWQASQPAGAMLSGTWASPGGRLRPFVLREEYQDARHHQLAVRYEILTEGAEGPLPQPKDGAAANSNYSATATLERGYLHLLGPDTLRPALRQLQCPGPARRRAERQAYLRDNPVQEETEGITDVTFNDYGLLSVSTFQTWYSGGTHLGHSAGNAIYDLATGAPVELAQLLWPSAEAQFRALVIRHFQADADSLPEDWLDADQPAVAGHVGLELNNILLTFEESDLTNKVVGGVKIYIPYAEVVPLLRPGTPLARMLRERGLWRPGNK